VGEHHDISAPSLSASGSGCRRSSCRLALAAGKRINTAHRGGSGVHAYAKPADGAYRHFAAKLKPVLTIDAGDIVTLETASLMTHFM